MTVFERIQSLAKKRGIPMSKLALTLGFSENLFYRWKSSDPKAVDLEKVADYFEVSVDYLLGRETETPKHTETDLSKMIDSAMSFDGEPVTDHDREIIMAFLKGKYGVKWGQYIWGLLLRS